MTVFSPKIILREINKIYLTELEQSGIDFKLAKIIASRPKHTHENIQASFLPKLQYLNSPHGLKDMDLAIERLILAIKNKEIIGIETDHDCDGQTSHAVIYSALKDIFGVPDVNIRSYIGHRMKEGYGLSDAVCDRILADQPRPSVLITADNGSADELRIARLKAVGIDVIVTDHHEVPLDGPPKSAYACLNPTREDCQFGDPYIAGCMVAWLLMAGINSKIKSQNLLDLIKPGAPSLASLLDFVAVGTIADCVSLSRSINNRAVIQAGLEKINQGTRPCWQAIRPLVKNPVVSSADCGFLIGPMLNSDGRLSDAFGSVSFLLSNSLEEASPWARVLYSQNETRKKIQKKMTDEAMGLAKERVNLGFASIVLFLPEGHAGIHGISASRIKDAFGRPVILFSPKEGEPEVITGSARSIDELHLKQILDQVAERIPQIILKHGGHRGAAGVAIKKSGFEEFREIFEQIVLENINNLEILGPKILIDGVLEPSEINLDFLDQIKTLEPFGREFEAPLFQIKAQISVPRAVGDGTHLQCQMILENGERYQAIFFGGAVDQNLAELSGQLVQAVVELSENFFRGRSLNLLIRHWEFLGNY